MAVPLLLVTFALGGCSGVDFWRTRADMRNDDMHSWIGREATASVGVRPSQFQLTENERQLRDYAYPLIEAPHSRPAWKSVFGDYTVIASPWRQQPPFDRTAYGRALIDEPHRTHSSRYAQLIDDVEGRTLAQASSRDGEGAKGSDKEAATRVGKLLAERATAAGIKDVVFDRGRYLFHGRVKALADGAREGGLNF